MAAAAVLAGGVLLGSVATAGANPIDPIGSLLDTLCPQREAPYPQTPAPTVLRPGSPGTYAKYHYAGLFWTTWDAGCLDSARADTAIGSQVNMAANMVDELVNEMQAAALDNKTTASFDAVISQALGGLRSAFWNPYALAGLSACGLLIAAGMGAGRVSAAATAGLSALAVVGLMAYVTANPTALADLGNGLTSTVASGVSQSLISTTPGGGMPASATPAEKYTEGYYQVSYRAWAEGSFCGDKSAEKAYAMKLLDAQAFTTQEVAAIAADPGLAEGLVTAKGEAWVKIGEDMETSHPTAFGCWRGSSSSRFSAAVKHGVVTVSAGFWIMLGSIALLALKWVLRLALLFAVTFGPIMLFSARMRERMVEFVLLGLLGPPMVAAGVGTLLWGYYAILISPQSWWQAGVSAFALGLALWFSKGILSRLFVGVSQSASGTSRAGRKAQRALANAGSSSGHGGGGSTTASVAGGVAGGVAAATVLDGGEDDARRVEDTARDGGVPTTTTQPMPRHGDTQPVPTRGDPTVPIHTERSDWSRFGDDGWAMPRAEDEPDGLRGFYSGDGRQQSPDDVAGPVPVTVPDDAVSEAMVRARRMSGRNDDARHPDA